MVGCHDLYNKTVNAFVKFIGAAPWFQEPSRCTGVRLKVLWLCIAIPLHMFTSSSHHWQTLLSLSL